MATALETTIEYYQELLLYQYINATKARATIGLLCSQAIADLVPVSVRDAFDLETATGSQLDILGEYIGFSRIISTPIVRDYLTFDDVTSLAAKTFGFTDYLTTLNDTASFYAYVMALSSTSALEDEEYRILLKLKGFINRSQNDLYSALETLHTLFGDGITLSDGQDMSIVYYVTSTLSRIVGIAYYQDLLPRPMGVKITGMFISENPASTFRLDDDTNPSIRTIGLSSYITGYSAGTIMSYSDEV
jgi:hypothetical protein